MVWNAKNLSLTSLLPFSKGTYSLVPSIKLFRLQLSFSTHVISKFNNYQVATVIHPWGSTNVTHSILISYWPLKGDQFWWIIWPKLQRGLRSKLDLMERFLHWKIAGFQVPSKISHINIKSKESASSDSKDHQCCVSFLITGRAKRSTLIWNSKE